MTRGRDAVVIPSPGGPEILARDRRPAFVGR